MLFCLFFNLNGDVKLVYKGQPGWQGARGKIMQWLKRKERRMTVRVTFMVDVRIQLLVERELG